MELREHGADEGASIRISGVWLGTVGSSLEMEGRLLDAVGGRAGPWVNHMPLEPMMSGFETGCACLLARTLGGAFNFSEPPFLQL